MFNRDSNNSIGEVSLRNWRQPKACGFALGFVKLYRRSDSDERGSSATVRESASLAVLITGELQHMCRNIKTLHNFKPPATEEEIRASAIQFVRKLSGFNKPSKANEAAFNHAVDEVTRVATDLLDSLVTTSPPRDREVEAAKARARTALRFRGAPAV